MRRLAEFVKNWLVPGSLPLLLIGTIAAAVLCNAGATAQSAGRTLLTMLALLYLLLSLPVVSNALIAGLGGEYGTIRDPRTAAGARVLVVVGNGSVHYTDGAHAVDYLTRRSVFCVFEAIRIHDLVNPDLVVVAGGVAGHPEAPPESRLIRHLLEQHGVAAERIVEEDGSRRTEEQVTNVIQLLRERRVDGPIVVVTTSAHMRRVATLFARSGVPVIPSVTPELRYDEGRRGWRAWVPAMSALTGSTSACYELLAGLRETLQPQRHT